MGADSCLSVEETPTNRPSQGNGQAAGHVCIPAHPTGSRPFQENRPQKERREPEAATDAGLHPVIGACVVSDRILIARE